MNDQARYNTVAIILHWLSAMLILCMIPYGFFMEDLPEAMRGDAIGLHKAIGITVLGLSLFRLVWRLLNPPPALPVGVAGWERSAAKLLHLVFYVLIIGMPLTGWLMSSASAKYPIGFFGLGTIPFLPMPEGIDPKATAHDFKELHELFAFAAIALIALHVGALIKHLRVDKTPLLYRMLPAKKA